MDDYSALAQRISVSVHGVSSVLILSRDGLVLGAYPNDDETRAKPAWLKFIALGEPERSFIEFTDQVWAYVRRGPYAAFATADVGTRPGVLVDQMEQLLLVAEEGRTRRDALRVPDPAAAPSGKPRTSLHPQQGTPVEAGPTEVPVAASPESVVVQPGPVIVEPSTADQKPAAASPTAPGEGLQDPSADDSEVDPILLAKEFSGLLQLDSDDDE